MDDGERRPLLQSGYPTPTETGPSVPGALPSYSAVPTGLFASAPPAPRQLRPNEVFYASTEDELPPAYTPSGYGTVPTIHCKVCQALINLAGRTDSHVVKCDQCQEATPIRYAPAGKKYVRCTCNCLLVCKAGARRVICPRPTCKKVILFGDQAVNTAQDTSSARVICAHCQQTFLFNLTNRALARCPHCRKISGIGRSYSLNRARFFFGIATAVLLIAILVTTLTHTNAQIHRGVISVYVLLYLLAVCCLLRSLYYYSIKASQLDITPSI